MWTSPAPASPSPAAKVSTRISAWLGPTYHKACARSLTCPPTRLPSCYREIAFGPSAPSPLAGEGRGGGSGDVAKDVPHSPTPTPDPSPKGGGEKKGAVPNAIALPSRE